MDICFKELMRNPAVRSGFAAAIMNCRPEEVEETYLMPTHLQKGKEEEKQGILDVRVLLKQGTQIGIEMQVNYFEYWDKLEIQMLELRKLPEGIAGGDGIFAWMKFLSGRSREEFENMAKTNEYLKEACDTLIQLSADDEKRLEYEASERALRDYNTQMQSAAEWGEKRGINKGKEMVLKNLFTRGISAEDGAALVEMDISAVRDMFNRWK